MSAQPLPEVLRQIQQPDARDHASRRALLLALCILLAYALAAAAAAASPVTPDVQVGSPNAGEENSSPPPHIVIDEPGIGTYWRRGEMARISWHHNLGPDARFIVEVSTDGGKTFQPVDSPIATATPTTGSFALPVFFKTTTQALVRVIHDQDVAVQDVNDYHFSIGPKPRPVRYRLTDLGGDDVWSEAAGLSANGQVAGSGLQLGGMPIAFRWDQSRVPLGTLGGCCGAAADVTSSGQAVGWADTATGASRAFLSEPGGTMRDLGTLGGHHSRATAINDAGMIVGSSAVDNSATSWRAFLWTQGSMRDLGTLGGPGSHATDVNNSGVVVGRSQTTANGFERAFAYVDGAMHDISPTHWHASGATAINDSGDIAGWRDVLFDETMAQTAFLRTADGRIRTLGALGGFRSMATAINGRGDVVGNVDESLAFIYASGSGGMRDLNVFIAPDSGWILRSATGINNRGQIAGTGEYNGLLRAFLLTPIVHLRSLSMPSRTLDACSLATLTITLDAPAPEDVHILLTTGRPVIEAQPDAVIPAGESSVDVVVSSNGWAAAREARITASYGDQTLALDLRVRPIAPRAVAMPATAQAGDVVAGTVILPCVAPEPIVVTIKSSAAQVASVETPRLTIRPGTSEGTFRVLARTDGRATITAKTYGGSLTTSLDVSGGAVPDVMSGPVVRNGHTYYLLGASSWYAAERRAQELSGHLVTINDDAENRWVFETFALHGGVPRMLWLGLTDARREGRFRWTSGESTSYRRFDGGEPDNDSRNTLGREDVVHMYPPIDRRGSFWNDVNGFPVGVFPFHGVVEVPRLP